MFLQPTKMAKTNEVLDPVPNLFDLSPPECMVHALHNTVSRTEKQHIGDLHVVHVTCTHVTFQNRMQEKLWAIVEAASFSYGVPDPASISHNRNVLKISLLSLQVRLGSLSVADMQQIDLDKLIDENPVFVRLLQLLDLHWGRADMGHVCSGLDCCESEEAFKHELYSHLLELDVLMSRDSDTPSLDDWGTALTCAAKVTFGVLCHRLLPQCVTTALPTWDDMLVAGEEGEDEAAAVNRVRIRKKAWRARCTLSDPIRMSHLCFLAVVGAPVQQCMLRVDSLDETGNSILECIRPQTSPFVACRKELRDIIRRGCTAGGQLTPIFEHFLVDDDANLSDMMDTARTMAQEFSVQNFHKTLCLKGAPFSCFGKCIRKRALKTKAVRLLMCSQADLVVAGHLQLRSSGISKLQSSCQVATAFGTECVWWHDT